MDEHNELCTRLRAVGMELFRREGLRFTMQQAAAMMHISKKTIYAVYPSKEALLLDMVDDAFTRIHARKQRILDGPGTLAEKLRAVIIALPEEYTALDLQQMDLFAKKFYRFSDYLGTTSQMSELLGISSISGILRFGRYPAYHGISEPHLALKSSKTVVETAAYYYAASLSIAAFAEV